jgi:hypothetical protein
MNVPILQVMAVINIVTGNLLWPECFTLENALRDLEAGWTPGDETLVTLLASGSRSLIQQASGTSNVLSQVRWTPCDDKVRGPFADLCLSFCFSKRRTNTAQLAVMTVAPVIVILARLLCCFLCAHSGFWPKQVNLGSLRLALLIGQQIAFNIEQCIGPLGVETEITLGTTTTTTSHSEAKAMAGRGSVGSRSHLSRSDSKYLATRRGSGPEKESLRSIQALQKAENDLFVVSPLACSFSLRKADGFTL